MKKKLAILLALLLAFVMVFMAGCGDDDEDSGSKKKKSKKEEATDVADDDLDLEDVIEGEWTAEFDLSKFIKNKMEEEDTDTAEMLEYFDFDDFSMKMNFEFDDGEVNISIDKDAFMEDFSELMKNALQKYFADHEDELGGSLDDILAMSGMTLDDLIDSMMSEDDMFEDFEDFEQDGVYEVDGNKIYLAEDEDELGDEENYIKVSIEGKKKLKIVEWKYDGKDIEKMKDFLSVIMKKN